jgi:BTB/POZ domain
MSPQTVRFNVGGQLFETSFSLWEQLPDSWVSAKVLDHVSDKSAATNASDEAIFIDRNSTHFGLMLDFLRHGSVSLPMTVSKVDFLRDLEEYGLAPATKQEQDMVIYYVPDEQYRLSLDFLEQSIKQVLLREAKRSKKQKAADFVAEACYKVFRKNGKVSPCKVWFDPEERTQEEDGFENALQVFDDEFDEEQFQEALAEYGLVFLKSEPSWSTIEAHVARKEWAEDQMKKEEEEFDKKLMRTPTETHPVNPQNRFNLIFSKKYSKVVSKMSGGEKKI